MVYRKTIDVLWAEATPEVIGKFEEAARCAREEAQAERKAEGDDEAKGKGSPETYNE